MQKTRLSQQGCTRRDPGFGLGKRDIALYSSSKRVVLMAMLACTMTFLHAPFLAASEPGEGDFIESKLTKDVGAFHGQVSNEAGEPVERLNVILEQAGRFVTAASTQANGSFAIDGLTPGAYTVSMARKGLTVPPLPQPDIAVAAGAITRMQLQLGEGEWLDQHTEQVSDDRGGPRILAEGLRVPVSQQEGSDEPNTRTSKFAFYPEPGFTLTEDQDKAAWSAENDAAFYTLVRRMIDQGVRPPAGAVRIQELLAHFTWDDPQPLDGQDLVLHAERGPCPWNPAWDILRLAVRTRPAPVASWPATRFLFLVDVSGSMQGRDRLSLVRSALRQTMDALGEADEVAIVTYRDRAAIRLPFVAASQRESILQTIAGLKPSGGTAGEAGLRLAYETALAVSGPDKETRIVVFSDGDFNVGPHTDDEVAVLLTQLRKQHIGLSVLGFGMGNYQDSKLDLLAKKGNGQYAYVDNLATAMRVLEREHQGKRVPVAQDVRLSVRFDPAYAQAWRLLGYEDRLLTAKEFRRGDGDGVNMGSDEHASALFLLRPGEGSAKQASSSQIRYKDAQTGRMRRLNIDLPERESTLSACSDDFRFATAVAGFGLLLRNSPMAEGMSVPLLVALAEEAQGTDSDKQRNLFAALIQRYEQQDVAGTLVEPVWQRATGAR